MTSNARTCVGSTGREKRGKERLVCLDVGAYWARNSISRRGEGAPGGERGVGVPGSERPSIYETHFQAGQRHLRGVDCALDDVEDGDVAALARARRHHDVLVAQYGWCGWYGCYWW